MLVAARRLRTTAIVCGIVLALYSPPVAWLYERVYWAPGRLLAGSWGIEDAMFCFHAGAVSWICALWPWAGIAEITPCLSVAVRRLLAVSLGAALMLALLLAAGVKVLPAFLLMQTASTALILARRPQYLRLAIPGAALFLAYYFLLLSLWRVLMPHFMDMWSGSDLTGRMLLGIPVEEYLWVLSFCTGFPITMAYAFDVGFQRLRTGRTSGRDDHLA